MFYHEKNTSGFFIWNDNTPGKYGPFSTIYSKNNFYGDEIFFDTSNYPGYKYSLGFTSERIFILKETGELQILNR